VPRGHNNTLNVSRAVVGEYEPGQLCREGRRGSALRCAGTLRGRIQGRTVLLGSNNLLNVSRA
jgi:hypothetical protein